MSTPSGPADDDAKDEPVWDERGADARDIGWGEYPVDDSNDCRLADDRPPHHA